MLKKVLIFIAGAFVGACVSYKYLEKKFTESMNETVGSIVDSYNKQFANSEPITKEEPKESEDSKEKAEGNTYSELSNMYRTPSENYIPYNKPNDIPKADDVVIIPGDEYGDIFDYSRIHLTLYADGYLADDMDEIVSDLGCIGGPEMLKNIGAAEVDALYIRNDARKCDYEIIASSLRYGDLFNTLP